ncbi:hypothetical protein BC835DRAFT_1310066 [Cytidiella melzeri]|nr:hypothetical protein BC835DRAFT_1310066 [Cytidiella melzeri]
MVSPPHQEQPPATLPACASSLLSPPSHLLPDTPMPMDSTLSAPTLAVVGSNNVTMGFASQKQPMSGTLALPPSLMLPVPSLLLACCSSPSLMNISPSTSASAVVQDDNVQMAPTPHPLIIKISAYLQSQAALVGSTRFCFELQDVVVSPNEERINSCEYSLSPVSELHLASFVSESGAALKTAIWLECLSSGLPFSTRFAPSVGAAFSRVRLADLQRAGYVPAAKPSWASHGECLSLYPALATIENIADIYLEAAYAAAKLPLFAQLLKYGGIIWRLAIEFGGIGLAASICAAPSDARVLSQRSSLFFPEGLNKNWASPAADKLAEVLISKFDGRIGYSMWPLQDILFDSYQWKGVWTRELEDWFKTWMQNIKNYQATLKTTQE